MADRESCRRCELRHCSPEARLEPAAPEREGDVSIECLRRILGHTTYVMVMRYVHLDKGDLTRDVDLRWPF